MKRWFTMKLADNDNDTGEIMIYDMIGKDPWTGEGMDATDFDAELKALGPVKNINLRINSPGGNVFDAVAIHTMLENHPAKITASIDGIAASAASLIAMAADNIVMPENAFMLIHEPSGFTVGTADEHLSAAADLERMNGTFANSYAKRSGQTIEAAKALMKADRLMTSSEAKDLGYADDISSAVKMAAVYDMRRLPEKTRAVMSAAVAADVPAAKVVEPVIIVSAAAIVPAAAAVPASVAVTPVTAASTVQAIEAAIMEPAKVIAASSAEPVAVVAAYGDAEIHATLDLCQLANMSSKASAFIKAKTPINKVRENLLAARALASDRHEIDPTPSETPKAHLDEWKELQGRVKAEMGIGKRK